MMRTILTILAVLVLAGCTARGPKYSIGDTVSLTGESSDTGSGMTGTGTVAEVISDTSTGKTIHFYRVDMGPLTAHMKELPPIREKFLKRAKR